MLTILQKWIKLLLVWLRGLFQQTPEETIMTTPLSIEVPFPVFQDRDGQPLENGYVWLGVANLNPQTNPVVAYFDAALTIVAPQPLRTLNGYISRAGTPAQIYVDGTSFSILVQDSKGSMVYNFPNGTGISPDACGVTYNPPFTGGVAIPVCEKLAQYVSVIDFGADPTGVADSLAAFDAAVAALQSGSRGGLLFIPRGTYTLSDTWEITCRMTIYGENQGEQPNTAASLLRFATNKTGIRVYSSFESPDGNSGAVTCIRDLCIESIVTGTIGHGIWASARVHLTNVTVDGFGENGINIVASATARTGNANLWSITNCLVRFNVAHGLYLDGNDVNAGVAINLNCTSNGGVGIYDSSFLGNTYIACHVASNVGTPIITDNANAQSVFLGCYSEGGESAFVSPTVVIGGIQSAESRITSTSTAFVLGGGGAYRKGFNYTNFKGAETIGSATGVDSSLMAAFSYGASSESGTFDAWKFKYDDVNNYWYWQFANSTNFEPIAYPNSASARAAVTSGALFRNGYQMGTRTAPIFRKMGSAAPTTGANVVGDIVFDSSPTAGGFIGWVCVTAGTPGTWKTFGAISA
jgi:hypothetical protein